MNSASVQYTINELSCTPSLQVYSQGPCPENAWLLPEGEEAEVYCECRDGFTFSPVEYNCQPALLLPPAHRFQSLWSNVAEYMERRRGHSDEDPSSAAPEAAEAGPSMAAKRRRRWESPREGVLLPTETRRQLSEVTPHLRPTQRRTVSRTSADRTKLTRQPARAAS